MVKILKSNIIQALVQRVTAMMRKAKPLAFNLTIPEKTQLTTTRAQQLGSKTGIPNGKYLSITTVRIRSYPAIEQENGIDIGLSRYSSGAEAMGIEDYFPAGTLGMSTYAFAKTYLIVGEVTINKGALYLVGRKGHDIGTYLVDSAKVVLIPLDY